MKITADSSLKEMANEFYKECKSDDLNEILVETRFLSYLKSMYAKHAFDCMGEKFKDLYHSQEKLLFKIKEAYKVRYGN